jgi:putative endonuclease
MSDAQKFGAGRRNYFAGQAAEEAVVRHYIAQGCQMAHQRWRGKAGEIDLIFRDGAALIFVEVKKSRSFEAAASHLAPRQIERLLRAAEEFLGGEAEGLLTESRFDVALVDAQGAVHILENALL